MNRLHRAKYSQGLEEDGPSLVTSSGGGTPGALIIDGKIDVNGNCEYTICSYTAKEL